MAVKKVALIGTENLSSSAYILPYNTEYFPEATLGTANNILESLLGSDYSLVKGEEGKFVYQDEEGKSFDTILFLKDPTTILGYAYLGRHYGGTYSEGDVVFETTKTIISLGGSNDSLVIGDQQIELKTEIIGQKPRTENVRRKPKVYSGPGNYGVYIRDFGRSGKKDIITDLGYTSVEKGYSGRLNLNIVEIPSGFEHTQISFYKGDPSIYLWNDEGQYTIISLTQEISFGGNFRIPKSYTPAIPGVSKSEIYQVPWGEIKYFAGQYCVIEYDEDLYVLDTSRQLNPEKGFLIRGKERVEDSFLYYRSTPTGWTLAAPTSSAIPFDSLDVAVGEIVKVPEYTPKYLNEFVVDQSLTAKVSPLSTYGWKSYSEALRGIGNLSNTELDSKTLVETGYSVVKKVGNWYVFDTPSATTRLWSNMIQTVEFSKKEEEPIVVNDEVLLEHRGDDYILYDLPGKYRSPGVKEGEWGLSRKVCGVPQDPLDIQKSFFNAFRRNILPSDVTGFKVVGALGGIIFYKIRNVVNYL